MAITLLMDQRGRCQASLQQVAERISPYWHNSVRAVTVPVQPEVLQPAVRMLADLGWWGLANMQFIPTADGARPIGSVPPMTTRTDRDVPTRPGAFRSSTRWRASVTLRRTGV